MRIALVTPRYRPAIGGVEIHVEKLAKGLAERGNQVEVLTQVERNAVGSERQPEGVVVRRFRTAIDSEHYAFAPTLAVHLARQANRYDLVHAHNYHALPALAAAGARVEKFILTPHYHGKSESPFRELLHRPYRVAGNWMMRRASKVISVANSEAELLARDFPRAREKITVIPNAVDAPALDAAAPFADESGRTVLFSAGRLERYKQVDLVIRSVEDLDESYVMMIAGDGGARPELERLVADRGLSGRVRLLGQIDRADLNRWFQTTDVYVSMSKIEAMGISVLEALYAGANVVASDIPAHREIRDLTAADLTLLNDGASASELAAAISTAATMKQVRPPGIPTWEDVVERTEEAYEETESPHRAR